MEPLNKSADLSALKIDRADEPRSRRLVWAAVATLVRRRGRRPVLPRPQQGRRAPAARGRDDARRPRDADAGLDRPDGVRATSSPARRPRSPRSRSGRIAWLNLEEGQKVKKGELVARLESQELEAQKRQYVAARDQVTRAARERAARPQPRQVAPRPEDRLAAGVRRRGRAGAARSTAQVASAEQQIKYTDELIKNAEIYAPIDGVVTVKKAFLGETVAPQGFGGAGSAGATFAVIVDLSSLEMEADINEQNVAKLSIGQPAEVALDAYPDKPYKARLRQIVPTADRQKGSVKVKIEILGKDARVLPEMSCRVVFLNPEAKVDEKAKPKVMVPAASVVRSAARRASSSSRTTRPSFRPLVLGPAAGSAGRGRVRRLGGRGDRRRRRDRLARLARANRTSASRKTDRRTRRRAAWRPRSSRSTRSSSSTRATRRSSPSSTSSR